MSEKLVRFLQPANVSQGFVSANLSEEYSCQGHRKIFYLMNPLTLLTYCEQSIIEPIHLNSNIEKIYMIQNISIFNKEKNSYFFTY